MSAQPDRSHTAQIVDMVRLLDSSSRRRESCQVEQRGSALLLSIRQSLRYQASVGLDDMPGLQSEYPKPQLDAYLGQVRRLLDAQFGRLRVYRYRQAFIVGHHNLEGLIAGLLRVQYYARQLQLTDRDSRPVPSLGWGVGATVLEADNERARRRRSNR
ncbi:hypothetical protein ACUNV4_14340 [Granulosicoccus sp. 3-233]|uniref:hypothetical protein n=1 Tax=Granulosicoccus sp. 3-233 TaxID=3417969 RepID=UPI003D352B12